MSRLKALLIAAPVAAGLLAAPAAHADWHGRGGGGWHGGFEHGHRGGPGVGGVILGLGAAALLGGVIASQAYGPPVYYAPPPAYYPPPTAYYAPPPVYYAQPPAAYYGPRY
jgi:hypothetical protein